MLGTFVKGKHNNRKYRVSTKIVIIEIIVDLTVIIIKPNELFAKGGEILKDPRTLTVCILQNSRVL